MFFCLLVAHTLLATRARTGGAIHGATAHTNVFVSCICGLIHFSARIRNAVAAVNIANNQTVSPTQQAPAANFWLVAHNFFAMPAAIIRVIAFVVLAIVSVPCCLACAFALVIPSTHSGPVACGFTMIVTICGLGTNFVLTQGSIITLVTFTFAFESLFELGGRKCLETGGQLGFRCLSVAMAISRSCTKLFMAVL
jgi:hypothetical protein